MAIKDLLARLKSIFKSKKKMETLFKKTYEISKETPAKSIVYDEVEGNIEFSYKIVDEVQNPKDSYTRYEVADPHHATILISNVKGYGVRLNEPFRLGTYMNKYNLYLTYVLYSSDENKWFIEVSYLYDRLKDGSNKQ